MKNKKSTMNNEIVKENKGRVYSKQQKRISKRGKSMKRNKQNTKYKEQE